MSDTTANEHQESHSIPGHPQSALEIETDDASNQPGPDDIVHHPSGVKLWLATGSVLMIALAKGLDTTIVAVTVPTLTDEFKTVNDIGWYSAASGLSLSAFTFFFGKIYTIFPLKSILTTSILIFTLGSLVCTLAPTSAVFITGRAICGLGSAGIGNGVVTILSRLFPLQKRPLWFGIVSGVQSIALVSAPVIGGLLIDSFSWRSCFGINLPLSIMAAMFMIFGFQDLTPSPSTEEQLPLHEKLKRLDLPSTLLIIPAVTSLLLALQWGGTRYSWSDPLIISLLAISGFLLAIFSLLQYRSGDKATLPPRILKNRSMLAGAWYQACCDGILAVTEYYIAIYFQGVRSFTATKAGALGLPMIIGLMVSSIGAGVGTSAVGYYTPFMLASNIIAPIPAGILTTLDLSSQLLKPLICLAALGTAIGLGINGPFSACQTVLPAADIPLGNALLTFGGGVGSSLFVSASSALFQRRLVDELKAYSPSTNATTLEQAGLSRIREIVGPKRLGEVLLGYDRAVVQTLYFPAGLAVLGLVGSAGMEWRSVKKKRE